MRECERCKTENVDSAIWCIYCGKTVVRVHDKSRQIRLDEVQDDTV